MKPPASAGEGKVENETSPMPSEPMKPFFSGPFLKAELLVTMLEKHGITAVWSFADPTAPDDGDLDRPCEVQVPAADYERAWTLFYADRGDEL